MAGSLAWAAPVVQVIAPPAHAVGSLQPTLSYVGLLLLRGSTYYRVKYEFDTKDETPPITVFHGSTWTAGDCDQNAGMPFYHKGAGLKLSETHTLSEALPPTEVVATYDVYNADGGFYVVLPVGVTMVDWIVHKGSCCAAQSSTTDDFATCQTDRTGGVYKVQFLQHISGDGGGNQWLFPAAPQDAACLLVGNTPYQQDCLPTSQTGTPQK